MTFGKTFKNLTVESTPRYLEKKRLYTRTLSINTVRNFLRVRSNGSVASDRPPGWSCKNSEDKSPEIQNKKVNSDPCFR